MAHRLPLADYQFIADFAAFARSKGDGAYEAGDSEICALAQFGHPNVIVWSGEEVDEDGEPSLVPFSAYEAVVRDDSGGYTFSALADRLEALLADAPVTVRA
jgi:hypothetical protein